MTPAEQYLESMRLYSEALERHLLQRERQRQFEQMIGMAIDRIAKQSRDIVMEMFLTGGYRP